MTTSKLLLRLLAAQMIGREPLISYELSLQYVGVYQAAGASWKMPSKFWEQDPMCLGRQPYFKLKILHRLGPSVYCKPWSSEMEPSHHFISLFKRVLFPCCGKSKCVLDQNISLITLEVFLLNSASQPPLHLCGNLAFVFDKLPKKYRWKKLEDE